MIRKKHIHNSLVRLRRRFICNILIFIISLILLLKFVSRVHAQDKNLNNFLFDRYTFNNGILVKVQNFYQQHNSFLKNKIAFFIIKIYVDSTVESSTIQYLENIIEDAFIDFNDKSKNEYTFPKRPRFYYGSEEFSIIKYDLFYQSNQVRYYALQELYISKDKNIIKLKANNVKISIYNIDGSINHYDVENTNVDLSGELIPSEMIDFSSSNSNEKIAQEIDDLINIFWEIHEIKKQNNITYLKHDFVRQNEEIYNNYIKYKLSKICRPRTELQFNNFLTRFLGNANVEFFDSLPINDQKFDLISTERIQKSDITKYENYSLYKISASTKHHKFLKLPSFAHWATIKDGMLHDIFITYPSERYFNDILFPLKKIFGMELGQKFYDDISRFLYGFTSALTIQDIDWLNEFYHDLSIRSYFPSISDSRFSPRKISIGKTNIFKAYESLYERNYEVYVTLNEGKAAINRPSTAWVLEGEENFNNWKSLGMISYNKKLSDSFKKSPAFLMTINLELIWRTIRRIDQRPVLIDTSSVEYTLLCLNMMQINNSIDERRFDKLSVFVLGSYLLDLWNDMYPEEKLFLKTNYSNIFCYLSENETILNSISDNENDRNIIKVTNRLMSTERYNLILDELKEFYSSKLRREVHNRRFLFNITYLKILYQYTYDNRRNILNVTPIKEFELFRKIFKLK